MEEQNKDEILEIDGEQLESLLGGVPDIDKLPPFEIDLEEYDLEEFQRGIHETSYLAGKITALLNVGLSESFILDYLLNQETIKHNLETAKINKDMNVEMSKNHKVTQEKYEL
jgi:hypothetical protein